jgi:DNA polymerase-3 subunit gamma/tau
MAAINRGWQLLTKGLSEVSQSDMPKAAADMVLVRVAHAATLPDPDEARAILAGAQTGASTTAPSASGSGSSNGAHARDSTSARAMGGDAPAMASGGGEPRLQARRSGGAALSLASAQAEPAPSQTPEPRADVSLARFEDVIALADRHRDILFKTRLERHVRLVRFEPPRIEFNLEPDAPGGLVQEISTRLEEWTGQRWIAVLSREDGAPPIAEQKAEVVRARHAAILRDPVVAAIMETFPGAEVIEEALAPDSTLPTVNDADRQGQTTQEHTTAGHDSDRDEDGLVYDDEPSEDDDF